MSIANYTTTISADKTVGEIQGMLSRAGAAAVMFEFEDSLVTAVSFKIPHNDVMISFRLPSNIDKMYVYLQNSDIPRRLRSREQAARVAWRIIKDWLRAQLAIIETEQAEMVEVFLPYAQNPVTGQTLFDQLKAGGFKQLAGPS